MAWDEAYLRSKWRLNPSSRLTTIHQRRFTFLPYPNYSQDSEAHVASRRRCTAQEGITIKSAGLNYRRYCTADEQWARAKLVGVEHRAPPVFGRATITLGIGPRSSICLFRCFCKNRPKIPPTCLGQMVTVYSPLTWGLATEPPPDVPECGFVGELCPPSIKGKPRNTWSVKSLFCSFMLHYKLMITCD